MSKIKYAIALLLSIVCIWSASAQDTPGVTNVGKTGTKKAPTYFNENGKLVCWPRVSPNGKLLKYGPVVTTDSVNSITNTSGKVFGNILHNGWCGTITEQGFIYSTTPDFSANVNSVTLSPTPTYTPCTTPPSCFCDNNSYYKVLEGLNPSTTYYYAAYAKNSCGTSYGDTLNFTTSGIIFTVAVAGDASKDLCANSTNTFTYTASTTPTSLESPSYQWYVNDVAQPGATSASFSYTVTATSNSTKNIKCAVTSQGSTANGTMSTAITVLANPSVTASNNGDICNTGSSTLTASGASTYVWSNSAATSNTTVTPTTTTTYTVTGTDANGCKATASTTVNVYKPALTGTASISGTSEICYNTSTTLSVTGVSSSTSAFTYQWQKDGADIVGATNSSYNTGNLTTGATYKCIVKASANGGSCLSTAQEPTITVTVNHPEISTFTLTAGANTVCSGSGTTITANVTGTGTIGYKWSDGSTSNSLMTGNLTTNSTYTCTITARMNPTATCSVTSTKSVTVTVSAPTPGTISIEPNDPQVCYNNSTTLTATATGSNGTLSYEWYNGATAVGTNSYQYTTGNLTANSTYTCKITATDPSTSCQTNNTTTAVTVTVNNPTLTGVTISGASSVCSGNSTTLTATATGTASSYSYKWYDGSTLVGSAQTFTTPALTAGKTYTCKVVGTTGTCSTAEQQSSHTINVTELTLTVNDITPTTSNICDGATETLYVTATGNGTLSYQWKTGSSNISGATSASYTTPALNSTTTYSCVVTNTVSGCTKSETVSRTVNVVTPSVGTLTLNGITICPETNTTLTVSASGNNGNLSYQWATGGSDITGATSASYTTPTLTATTSYTVNVTATTTSPITCTTTDSKNVTVTVTLPVFDTISICACQLPHYYNYTGGTLSFTNAEMDGASPRKDTLTKTYPIGSCAAAGHYTVTLWEPNKEEKTSCPNIYRFVDQRATKEVHSGTTLTGVAYNGYTYDVVQIGNQCWLKENLRTTLKPDGTTPIGPVYANSSATNTYYAYTGTQTLNYGCGTQALTFEEYTNRFGLMYNWFTAMDDNNPGENLHKHQGICPDGWHIPDTTEFQTMANFVGIVGTWSGPNVGNQQISTGTHGVRLATGCEWKSSTVLTSPGDYTSTERNSSGFSARPSGCWNNAGTPGWYQLGSWAFFWSCTRQMNCLSGGVAAYNFDLHPDWAGLSRDNNGNDQSIGRSIRCIRNEDDGIVYTSTVTPGDNSASCAYTTVVAGTSGICWNTTGNPTTADAHTTATTAAGNFSNDMTGLSEHTLYHVRAYVIVDGLTIYGNELTFRVHSAPIVVTADSTVNQSTATLRGNLTDAGGYDDTERGICWGTTSVPTTKVAASGSNEGVYSVDINGLTGGTTYYYRAYAGNAKDTVWGDVKSFTTPNCSGTISYNGDTYPIGLMGEQCWILANLRTTKTNTGGALTQGGHGSYSPDPRYYETINVSVYGRLYNHAAATQVCPSGWRLPTKGEWLALDAWAKATYPCSGESAKSLCSNGYWGIGGTADYCAPGYQSSGLNTGNNASGFTLTPAGVDHSGSYYAYQQAVNLWSSTPQDGGYWYAYFTWNQLYMGGGASAATVNSGFTVRCIKD